MKKTVKKEVCSSHDFYISENKNAKRIYLLLHGYLLDGKFMFDFFKDYLPDDGVIISPNAPFMIPVKKKDKYKMKYSWYFYDSKEDEYYIDYGPAIEFLSSFIDSDLPVTVIGYSQGGYLAPAVGASLKKCDRVIGLSCNFKSELFEMKERIHYSLVHGETDQVVELSGVVEEFNKLKKIDTNIDLTILKDQGHRLNFCFLKGARKALHS